MAARPGTRRPGTRRLARSAWRPTPLRTGTRRWRSRRGMIASAPSRTADATSVASARVGRGDRIIDSSICVATITGLSETLAALSSRFCTRISSIGSSTPRSPRATITASATSRICSKPSTAGRVSILATIGRGRSPSPRGAPRCRRDPDEGLRDEIDAEVEHVPQHLPVPLGHRRQAQSLGGHVHALVAADRAGAHALGLHAVARGSGDRELHGAVREQDPVADPEVARERMGLASPSRRRAPRVGSRTTGRPGTRTVGIHVREADLRLGRSARIESERPVTPPPRARSRRSGRGPPACRASS